MHVDRATTDFHCDAEYVAQKSLRKAAVEEHVAFAEERGIMAEKESRVYDYKISIAKLSFSPRFNSLIINLDVTA